MLCHDDDAAFLAFPLGCTGVSLPELGQFSKWPSDDRCDGAQPGATCTASCPGDCDVGPTGPHMVTCTSTTTTTILGSVVNTTWSAVEGDCKCGEQHHSTCSKRRQSYKCMCKQSRATAGSSGQPDISIHVLPQLLRPFKMVWYLALL